MSALLLDGVVDDWFGPLTLRIDPGLSVLTGDAPPIGRIVELAAGVRAPRRGHVRLGERPLRDRDVQRRVAALLPEEELFAARTVEQALAGILTLRGLPLTASDVLSRAGLEALAQRRPSRLHALERRAVALALALADPVAQALVLYDPLACSPLIRREEVLKACLESARDKPVLVATPHLEDALLLGGALLTFARGTVFATPAQRAGQGVSIAVRSKQARRLAGLLADEPGTLGVVFDAERAPFEVVIKALDPELLADTITRVACEHAIPIASLTTTHTASPTALAMPGPWVTSRHPRLPAGAPR